MTNRFVFYAGSFMRSILFSMLLLVSSLVSAQSEDQPVDAHVSRNANLLDRISRERAEIHDLEHRALTQEGLAAAILAERLVRVQMSLFQDILQLAENLLDTAATVSEEDSEDHSAIRAQILEDLAILPDAAKDAIEGLRQRMVFPSPEMPPEEFVVADQRLIRSQKELDDIYRVLLDYVRIAAAFDKDIEQEKQFLINTMSDAAANRSAFLELALDERDTLRPAVAALPTNTDLAERYAASLTRVKLAAATTQDAVTLMNDLELETGHYRQQILQVTGEITTDVLDFGIVASLLSEWGNSLADLVAKDGLQLVFRLILVIAILFAALQIANLAQKLVNKALDASGINISNLLRQMIVSSSRNLIVLFGFLIAISQIGISLGPLLAGLGIAGFIVGFALQDTLGNFASGILILFYRPFDVGDVVEAGGVMGKVSHMSLVNTTFMTFDNQKLVVPNNQIWGSVIKNVTAQTTRRVDLKFGISYGDDIEKTERVLAEVVSAHPKVLKEPETVIKVHELGESSVNFIVRPWVNTDDYWDTYWDLTRAVKMRFDKEDISIPFPQRDVHMIEKPGG